MIAMQMPRGSTPGRMILNKINTSAKIMLVRKEIGEPVCLKNSVVKLTTTEMSVVEGKARICRAGPSQFTRRPQERLDNGRDALPFCRLVVFGGFARSPKTVRKSYTFGWKQVLSNTSTRHLNRKIRGGVAPEFLTVPPRFAIVDLFVIGHYAIFDRASCIELQAIAFAELRGIVMVIFGGPGRKLHSHIICWDNLDATLASAIPHDVDSDSFYVVLAGTFTPAQEVRLKQLYELDLRKLRELHHTLYDVAENHLARRLPRNCPFNFERRLEEEENCMHTAAQEGISEESAMQPDAAYTEPSSTEPQFRRMTVEKLITRLNVDEDVDGLMKVLTRGNLTWYEMVFMEIYQDNPSRKTEQ
ncbi:hypothetical protein HK102_007825 [Quaeritorhiza haematococci]|nr:hypothetical protein HK102_007825 [Quaeritorhiza haematococci]